MRCCRQCHPALLGATMRHQAAPALAASSILQRARSTGNGCRNFNASFAALARVPPLLALPGFLIRAGRAE